MTMNNAKPAMNLQDSFFKPCQKGKPWRNYLPCERFPNQGLVRGFDNFTVYYRKRRQAAACL